MAVLALAVKQLAKFTRLIEAAHFHALLREGVVFGDHIYLSALLNCAAELNALGKSAHSNALGENVLALAECLDSELSVLVEVVCENYRVDVCLFKHLIVIGVGFESLILVIVLALDYSELLGVSVTDSHKLHIKRRIGVHKGSASTRTNDSVLNRFHNFSFPMIR